LSAYKIISAVIPERVDDSPTDRYLIVAPEDRIVWVSTNKPQDLSPESRKRAMQQAEIFNLLGKLKREENAVESESSTSEIDIDEDLTEADFEQFSGITPEPECEEGEEEELVLIDYWDLEIH
jgi:hypothetical protein